MINFEKIKQKKSQVPPLLSRPTPSPYFHDFFSFFRFLPPREVIKIHFPPWIRTMRTQATHATYEHTQPTQFNKLTHKLHKIG